jgi:cystathionine beta-lyase
MAHESPIPDHGTLSTSLIHHPYRPPGGFGSVQPAVHKASTVIFESVAALRARD